jgi:long-chain acyl-CoA synthetase
LLRCKVGANVLTTRGVSSRDTPEEKRMRNSESDSRRIERAIAGLTLVGSALARLANGVNDALVWREQDGWKQLRWAEYIDRASRVASGLVRLGVQRGDRVLFLMNNRPEFHVTDLACSLLGAVPVSVFVSSSTEQIAAIANSAQPRMAVLENEVLLSRLSETGFPLQRALLIEGSAASAQTYAELERETALDLEAAAAATAPEDVATICYTSGTTGAPKGVIWTQRAVLWWAESVRIGFDPRVARRGLSYLPMSTMLERLACHYLPLVNGARVVTCPDPSRVVEYLLAVRPQYFAGVPRIWERLRARLLCAIPTGSLLQAQLERALERRRVAAAPTAKEERLRAMESEQFAPLRRMVGLDACELPVVGAAPVPAELSLFFSVIGVPLLASYGLTECTACVNQFAEIVPGCVGEPSPGCELALGAEGEILIRSGNLFRGYYRDEQATRDAIDADGWFHTGDIGRWDASGQLQIIDRKKELIVTPDGRNVSPASLEAALTRDPLVAQACVIGDGRPHLAALLVLDPREVERLLCSSKRGAPGSDESADLRVRGAVDEIVQRVNGALSPAERIERYVLLEREWTPASGELTPTLKLRRRVIQRQYADEIEAMYARTGSETSSAA